MNSRVLIGGLLGALAYLFQGLAVGFLFLNDAYSKYTNPGLSKGLEVNLWLIALASILISFLLAYVFSNWRGGINTQKGAFAGAIIFVLACGAFDLATYASTNLYNGFGIIFLSAAGSLIAGAVVGGVVGWWLSRK